MCVHMHEYNYDILKKKSQPGSATMVTFQSVEIQALWFILSRLLKNSVTRLFGEENGSRMRTPFLPGYVAKVWTCCVSC